ncbi:MAG: hypothetical protein AMXMBFR13_16990 [Phycisphaerae bacterium]
MDRAVILLSGGINSTVVAALAREQYEPALLHVAWGHRTAERELLAFEQIVGALKAERTYIVELSSLAAMGGNARTSKRLSIDDANALGRSTPTTFVLGLLPAMISVAAAWAATISAKKIILGLSENHGVGGPPMAELYPDHRREFIQIANLLLDYAKPADRELSVEVPLIELTRPEVVKLGARLGVPWDKTWSCYRNTDTPCGRCRPCVTRAAGFLRAGIPDPLLLEPAKA